MFTLNYSIGLSLIEDKALTKTLPTPNEYQAISHYKGIDKIRLKSNSPNISDAYIRSFHKTATLYRRDNLLYKQEKQSTFSDNQVVDVFDQEIERLASDVFFKKYGRYIVGILTNPVPINVVAKDEIRLVRVNSRDELSFIAPDSYLYSTEIGADGKVEVSGTILNQEEVFVLVFRSNSMYIRTSDTFDIEAHKLLSINSGFYRILPKYYDKEESFTYSNGKLSSKSFETLSSDVFINYDGCSTNSFSLLPNTPTTLSYKEDYTPYSEITSLDSSKEYILFKSENNKLIPLYHLTTTGIPHLDYDELKNSHTEFKRGYVIVANIATVTVGGSNTIKVENAVFNEILAKHNQLIKVIP